MATPSLVIVPDRYKAGKLYSQIPVDGTGDFTVTRSTTATRVNASGLIESVASGVPRLDYPASGGCPALLVEPAATNLALYSEEFDDVYWVKGNVTINANATNSPNGGLNADKIIDDITNGQHSVAVFYSNISGDFTQSFFVKPAEYTKCCIENYSDGGRVIFDLSFNTVISTSANFKNAKIETGFFNGFVRISATTDGTTGNKAIGLGLINASNQDTFAGTGTSGLFVWGAQMEAGSYPTSYIPTTTATVTRNADVITKTGVSGFIGQTEGTLYAEIEITQNISARRIFGISDGTPSNRLAFTMPGMQIRTLLDGNSVLISSSVLTAGIYKIAIGYNLSEVIMYINGSLIGTSLTDGSGAYSRIDVGQTETGTAQFNDRIRAAAIYTSRLSNAELAQLTTL